MNRLVLIGNGFDLALGLRTSYSDFLIWMIKKYISKAHACRGEMVSEIGHSNGYFRNKLFSIEWSQSLVFEKEEFDQIKNLAELNSFKKRFSIKTANETPLFKRIINHAGQKGWVNLEQEFYSLLIECIRPREYTIENLNSDLDFLRQEIEEYLSEIEKDPIDWNTIGYPLVDQFNTSFHRKAIDSPSEAENYPETTCFVNFNYTKTVWDFVDQFRRYIKSHLQVIPIHGNLKSKKQPVVFGFGDETDKNYEKIEDLNKNVFFEHIKSFKYSQTRNYQDLIRFLDSANYQVFIYGHSCGLSDRTMLKEIFEHENCETIKVFYYKRPDGSDDFLEKTMEISRHFSDKALMRRKVANKELSSPIPQNNS